MNFTAKRNRRAEEGAQFNEGERDKQDTEDDACHAGTC